jgi:hypothetical protein
VLQKHSNEGETFFLEARKITESFRRALFSRDKNLHIFTIYFHSVRFFCCLINIFMASGQKVCALLRLLLISCVCFPLETIAAEKGRRTLSGGMKIPMNISTTSDIPFSIFSCLPMTTAESKQHN